MKKHPKQFPLSLHIWRESTRDVSCTKLLKFTTNFWFKRGENTKWMNKMNEPHHCLDENSHALGDYSDDVPRDVHPICTEGPTSYEVGQNDVLFYSRFWHLFKKKKKGLFPHGDWKQKKSSSQSQQCQWDNYWGEKTFFFVVFLYLLQMFQLNNRRVLFFCGNNGSQEEVSISWCSSPYLCLFNDGTGIMVPWFLPFLASEQVVNIPIKLNNKIE